MFKKVMRFGGGVVEKVKDVVTSKAALIVGGLAATTGLAARADDLGTSLQGAATTAVSSALAVIGVVLLAGIAKPVAMKAYGIVKQVIAKF